MNRCVYRNGKSDSNCTAVSPIPGFTTSLISPSVSRQQAQKLKEAGIEVPEGGRKGLDVEEENKKLKAELKKLKEEFEITKKALQTSENDVKAIKKQAENLTKEYDRLLEEHSKLQVSVRVRFCVFSHLVQPVETGALI
ncbi:BAP31 protein, partial [Polyodon spathula]|nr:BAP31 protein [Polyodon spathula]